MSLYQANDFSELLLMIGTCRRRGRIGIYARLARQLGLQSPRTIAMVIKKQRGPSASLVKLIISHQGYTPMEQEYLQLLAEKSRREVKRKSLEAIEERIRRHQQVQQIQVAEQIVLGGVRIEIPPHAEGDVKKRILECVKALLGERGEG